jgi:hypothetical protein
MSTIEQHPAPVPPSQPSPFLPTDRDQLPSLEQIKIPTGAVAEYQQQMTYAPVDLPFFRCRGSQRVRSNSPSIGAVPSFKYAWNAFCSARMASVARNTAEAEAMLSAESMELLASFNKQAPKNGSVPPRSMCIALVVPANAVNSAATLLFLDGFAAMSDIKLEDGPPIATKVRFAVYGGDCSLPVCKLLSKKALGRSNIDGVSLVLRWHEQGPDGEITDRVECVGLGVTIPGSNEAATHIQMAVVKMSSAFGFQPPPCLFREPPECFVGYYEKQVIDCSNEFCKLFHSEETFNPSPEMVRKQSGLLSRVPACYVRLTPIALGLSGVVSPDAIHAILLCAEGKEEAALRYVKTYREGLRPPDGEDALLDLHTIAIQTSRVHIDGMVSLYAHGGKPGESLKPDGNWIYKTTAAIVPINSLTSNFFVMSCDMKSMVPTNPALVKYMDVHMNKSIAMFQSVFCADDIEKLNSDSQVTRFHVQPCAPVFKEHMKPDDRFVLSALGVDLKSSRMLLGDAVAHLIETGAPNSLIEMLTGAITRVGLRSSLSDAFLSCAKAMKNESHTNEAHSHEVERLKRVADAALMIGCNKRACYAIPETKPEKVRMLMKSFALKSGSTITRMDDFLTIPRSYEHAHSLALTVSECYARKSQTENAHLAQLETVFYRYKDLIEAIAKGLHLCMVKPGKKKDAFIIIHGHDMTNVSVNQVTEHGSAVACGIGKVFEADRPCVIIVKLRSECSCIVTPLVTDPGSGGC